MNRIAILLLSVLFIAACSGDPDTPPAGSDAWCADSVVQSIYDQRDRREGAALTQWFNHENAHYRQLAAWSFGSLQDSAYINELAGLLSDSVAAVRRAAAWSLGQTGDARSVGPLRARLGSEKDNAALGAVLEALGQCGGLQANADIISAEAPDSLIAKGLYRLSARGKLEPDGMSWAASKLFDKNAGTRLLAAHVLNRHRGDLISVEKDLESAARKEQDPIVRMAIVRALGNVDSDKVSNALLAMIRDGRTDARIRINACYSISKRYGDKLPPEIREALHSGVDKEADPRLNEAMAQAWVPAGNDEMSVTEYVRLASEAATPHARSLLYERAMQLHKWNSICDRCYSELYARTREMQDQTENPFIRRRLLSVISAHERFRADAAHIPDSLEPADRNAWATGIIRYLETGMNHDLGLAPKLWADVAYLLRDHDAGVAAQTGEFLSAYAPAFRSVPGAAELADSVAGTFDPIGDVESVNLLRKVAAIIREADPPEHQTAPYNTPIDWDYLSSLGDSPNLKVKTNRGEMTWRLEPRTAPGTVTMICKLAEEGYYNGKIWHRVVPNFVAQGGCPRGDGWGGLSKTVRSEFGYLSYGTGAVGMASAGKDTESCQFFITHSPFPHLDGRYTIFAYVDSGMNVAQMLEAGDLINSVEVIR